MISTTSRTDDVRPCDSSSVEWIFFTYSTDSSDINIDLASNEIYDMPPLPPAERDPSRGIRHRLIARPPVPVARRGLPHTLPYRERETVFGGGR